MILGVKWGEKSYQSWLFCVKPFRRWREERSRHWQLPAAGDSPGRSAPGAGAVANTEVL